MSDKNLVKKKYEEKLPQTVLYKSFASESMIDLIFLSKHIGDISEKNPELGEGFRVVLRNLKKEKGQNICDPEMKYILLAQKRLKQIDEKLGITVVDTVLDYIDGANSSIQIVYKRAMDFGISAEYGQLSDTLQSYCDFF